MPYGPPINTSVTLDVAGWAAPRRTRVDDVDDGQLLVAAPAEPGDDHQPSIGASLTMTWQGDRGLLSLPVTLAATEPGALERWRLRAEGPVERTQRRRYVRTGTLIPLVIETSCGTIDGHLLDLSEGGLLSVYRSAMPLAVGERIVAEFHAGERDLRVCSEVVRADRDDGRCYAGCRFLHERPQDADVIRNIVFQLQARDRRWR